MSVLPLKGLLSVRIILVTLRARVDIKGSNLEYVHEEM